MNSNNMSLSMILNHLLHLFHFKSDASISQFESDPVKIVRIRITKVT